MAKAEQEGYDASMTKTAQSLTFQLKDVAPAFYLEVWGEALNAVGVDVDTKLRRTSKIYYSPTLHIAPSFAPPLPDSSYASQAPKSTTVPTPTPSAGKEKE